MWIQEFAHQMALLPLVCLLWRRDQWRSIDASWWWLVAAFEVSWVADAVTKRIPESAQWIPSVLYPVIQATLVYAVFLPRRIVAFLLLVLTVSALRIVLHGDATKPDIVLRTIAWFPIVIVVARRSDLPTILRASLLVYFGLGLITWSVHVRWPVVATWYPYQFIRLVGLVVFCVAATQAMRVLNHDGVYES